MVESVEDYETIQENKEELRTIEDEILSLRVKEGVMVRTLQEYVRICIINVVESMDNISESGCDIRV